MATLTGRVAHTFSTRLGSISRWYGRRHVRDFEASGGTRRTKIVSGNEVFRLTVPGRRTGTPRSVMLVLVRHGDSLLACASNGGHSTEPEWSRNLRAAGAGEVRVGPDVWAVSAREPTGAERETCWARLIAVYPDFASYQELTGRQLAVWVLEPA